MELHSVWRPSVQSLNFIASSFPEMLQNWCFAQNKENQCKGGKKKRRRAITFDSEYILYAGKQKTWS